MRALQTKHNISFGGMLLPAFFSIPFFMSCFFGLQEMHFV
jgi:membrane protein insertase Oxa1/YidC/SpoIIIJ